MNTTELSPEIPRFENDPRDWNWEAAIKECMGNEPWSEDGDPFHSLLIGSVMSIMPSGKYWTLFACGNVDEEEQNNDIAYNDLLEDCVDEAGGWIENGLNGDLCDMFFCLPCNEDSYDLEEAMAKDEYEEVR